eukprot:GHVL01018072.1.p1 GENE.GHVL01018072.1~~GHVL01018072.1.p1  ORF type:complete len:310 (+),score=61.19 GHVL01018072.1:1480-2409(+)
MVFFCFLVQNENDEEMPLKPDISLLQYSLPEDIYLTGYVPYPLYFPPLIPTIEIKNENGSDEDEVVFIKPKQAKSEEKIRTRCKVEAPVKLISDIRVARLWCICETFPEFTKIYNDRIRKEQVTKKKKKKNIVMCGMTQIRDNSKPIVVIDGANVAMRLGEGKTFSCIGIKRCVQYFLRHNCHPLVFLKDKILDVQEIVNIRRAKTKGWQLGPMPDDPDILTKLKKDGFVLTVPDREYDDTWMLDFARKKSVVIVSNDQYRDYIQKLPDKQKDDAKKFLRHYVVGFSFFQGEFFASKNFEWPDKYLEYE